MRILVIVAIIQVKILKTEVGNGSMSTAIEHGLAGPKRLCKARIDEGGSQGLFSLMFLERENG